MKEYLNEESDEGWGHGGTARILRKQQYLLNENVELVSSYPAQPERSELINWNFLSEYTIVIQLSSNFSELFTSEV